MSAPEPDRAAGAETPALTVDSRGRLCPLPIIDIARRIGDVGVGEVVELLADDPAAAADVPAWCRLRGHEYLGEGPQPASYLVRRLA